MTSRAHEGIGPHRDTSYAYRERSDLICFKEFVIV